MNIKQAQQEIAKILKQLEIDTQSVVEYVRIEDYDGTCVSDVRPRIFRRVVIDLKRLPGTCWE